MIRVGTRRSALATAQTELVLHDLRKTNPSVTFEIVFISTEGEDHLPYAMRALGDTNVVWASDYPHWDSSFPRSVTKVTSRSDLTDEQRRAMFATNPKRLYGWA